MPSSIRVGWIPACRCCRSRSPRLCWLQRSGKFSTGPSFGCGGASLRRANEKIRLPLAADGSTFERLLRGRLGVHVDDLNAAVGRVHRGVRILRLGLAVSDGHEVGAGEAVLLGQVLLDRV